MHNKYSEKCKAILLSATISLDLDTPELHPDKVCNSCYITLGKQEGPVSMFTWLLHTESCHLCKMASEESVGG